MPKPRILMIGPGQPDARNTGLGKAVKSIEQYLAANASLLLIQPGEEENVDTTLQENYELEAHFTEEKMIGESVSIGVGRALGPYFAYQDMSAQDAQNLKSEMQKQYDHYAEKVLAVAEKQKFDVIYGHDWLSVKAGLALKKKTGRPFVLHIHSLDIDRWWENHESWINDLEKEGLAAADKVIAVSQYTANRLIEFHDVPKSKIEIIHPAIPAPAPASARKMNQPFVLFVGRLSDQKNPETFVNIAEKVLQSQADVRFAIAGEGHMHYGLMELAAQKSIGDKIHFTGYLNEAELAEVYAMASVLCMPSVSEPFGLVAVEATQAHLPVIISKQSGVAEVLTAAPTADYWDVDSFASGILALLHDDTIGEKQLQENLQALSQFTEPEQGNRILALLHKISRAS